MEHRLIFGERDIADLRAIGVTRRFRSGELLFATGDRSDHVVVIVRGMVKVFSVSREGYETVLAVRSVGEIVGEFAALDGGTRSASVQAIGEVDGILVGGERFRSFLATHPAAAMAVLGCVVGRIRESDRRRAEFGPRRVIDRVARLLLELVDDYGSPAAGGPGATITVPLSQAELAGAVGASREAVARSLRRLRERGAIRTQRRHITVVRPSLLRDTGPAPPVRAPRQAEPGRPVTPAARPRGSARR